MITVLGAWLLGSSTLGAALFLPSGALMAIVHELHWRPKDQAFEERVRAIEALGGSAEGLMEQRAWPCSEYHIHYDYGEFWTED